MGKRSDFERKPRDFYPTPYEAVVPLLPHLKDISTFVEPCGGNGALMEHLEKHWLTCSWISDIEPSRQDVTELDAFKITKEMVENADAIISNPPWDRKLFHPLIDHLVALDKPVWLLADADWIHTKQSTRFVQCYLKKIVSIGRVKWFDNTTGKDNCCWYLFQKNSEATPKFYGRAA